MTCYTIGLGGVLWKTSCHPSRTMFCHDPSFFQSALKNFSPMSFYSKTGNLLVPGRVTASTSIPQGYTSKPIEVERLKGQSEIVQLSVAANGMSLFELDDTSVKVHDNKTHWIRNVRISEDCHNFNVQLRLLACKNDVFGCNKSINKLILQTVRPIDAGQELLLWFSEDVLALLQMWFLSPANIQGQNKYVCTFCSKMYESPNPLKIHLTLSCEKYDVSALWEKLAHSLTENVENSKKTFSFKLYEDPANLAKQKSAIDLSLSPVLKQEEEKDIKPQILTNNAPETTKNNSKEPTKNLYRPFMDSQRSSAFKPFQKSEENVLNNSNNFHGPNQHAMFYTITNNTHYNFEDFTLRRMEEDAHIETLVSGLGKSNKGHVCLYCGKCYSRKYGLKIHIRTHTGYKPLKCKYCLRPFGDPSNLNKHVRLHAEGETPYKCDICGKVLVRRRDLERHLKSRHMDEMHPAKSLEEEEDTDVISASLSEEEENSSPIVKV